MTAPVSAEQVLDAVHNAQDQIASIQTRTLTSEQIATAVAHGIAQAVSDPKVWSAALVAVQSRAKTEAGGWLFGGLKAVFSKIAWVLFIGMGIYLVGGWSALAAFLKTGVAHP
jgi:hypothetical protein